MAAPLNRRNFLKGLAAASTLAAGGGAAVAARPEEQPILVATGAPIAAALKADVLVVGAGASGVPAAIAAARGGARVILLEEDQQPGGAPVDMYVAMLCGNPRVGIFQEMIGKLDRFVITGRPEDRNLKSRWFMPVAFVQVILEMLKAEKNIEPIFGATVNGVLVSEGARNRVRGVSFSRVDGSVQKVEAAVTIDATGTGLIAALAGCEYMYGRDARSTFNEPIGTDVADNRVQPSTLMMISQRLKPEGKPNWDEMKGRDPAVGSMKPGNREKYIQLNTGVYLHWAGTVQCQDTRDPVCIAASYREALEKITPKIMDLYRSGYLVHVAPKLGIREVRRVRGDSVLTVNDLKSGKKAEDMVAIGMYWLDAWGEKDIAKKLKLPPFAIPYRALLPKDTDGLLVAGKAISSTHLALSAYRVQPIVACIGQAAGTAAAMAVGKKIDLRAVPLAELQGQLKGAGVLYDEPGFRA